MGESPSQPPCPALWLPALWLPVLEPPTQLGSASSSPTHPTQVPRANLWSLAEHHLPSPGTGGQERGLGTLWRVCAHQSGSWRGGNNS